jgi:RHS repeat-associated protein
MTFDAEFRDTATTGFTNLRARLYDPATASFLTQDPIGASPDYSFASANPAMNSDPSGLASIGETWSEMWRNPASSWQAGPTAPKVIGFTLMAIGTIGIAGLAIGGTAGAVMASAAKGALIGALSNAGAYSIVAGLSPSVPFSSDDLALSTLSGALVGGMTGYFAGMATALTPWLSKVGLVGRSALGGTLGGGVATLASIEVVCGRPPTIGEMAAGSLFGGLGAGGGGTAATLASRAGGAGAAEALGGFAVDLLGSSGNGGC